jgi:hypothetical protein
MQQRNAGFLYKLKLEILTTNDTLDFLNSYKYRFIKFNHTTKRS